jgi:hypothetical protein
MWQQITCCESLTPLSDHYKLWMFPSYEVDRRQWVGSTVTCKFGSIKELLEGRGVSCQSAVRKKVKTFLTERFSQVGSWKTEGALTTASRPPFLLALPLSYNSSRLYLLSVLCLKKEGSTLLAKAYEPKGFLLQRWTSSELCRGGSESDAWRATAEVPTVSLRESALTTVSGSF